MNSSRSYREKIDLLRCSTGTGTTDICTPWFAQVQEHQGHIQEIGLYKLSLNPRCPILYSGNKLLYLLSRISEKNLRECE